MSIGVRQFPRGVLFSGVIAYLVLLAPFATAAEGRCDAGLFDFACETGKAVADDAGEVISAPIHAAAGGAVDMITSWVSDGALWLLGKVVNFIDTSTTPDLTAGWFTERYRFMIGLAALVLVPILLLAALRALINQDVGQLLRSFFLHLPVAIIGTFVAVFLTQTLLTATDEMSAAVASGIAGDVSQIFDGIRKMLGPAHVAAPGAPSFAIFIGALFLVIGAFFVWIELLIRSAALTVSVFILPLLLAGLVWPQTARWARRVVETLVALILSKFLIVSVISLATAALSNAGQGGFGTLMGGAALMLMAAFSPIALLKLIPIAEGAAMNHLEGVGRKPLQTVRPGGSVNQAASIMRSKIASGKASSGVATAGAATAGVATAGVATAGTAAVAVGVARAAGKAAKSPRHKLDRQADVVTPKSARSTRGIGGSIGKGSSKPPKKDG